MSRSGYCCDLDQWELIMWRGAVASGLRGKRGQAFLRELIEALDRMPQKQLIVGELVDAGGSVCALGCVGAARGLDMQRWDSTEHDDMAQKFGISQAMVKEIEFVNDDGSFYAPQTDEARWTNVRAWAEKQLVP